MIKEEVVQNLMSSCNSDSPVCKFIFLFFDEVEIDIECEREND